MADRMPRPPRAIANSVSSTADYLEILAGSVDRAIRELEIKIKSLEEEIKRLKKENDGK